MRRLLYLALVLVVLTMTGLAYVRVSASGAYVVRDRALRIQPGITRAEVLGIMADLRKAESADSWVVGSYALTVFYETDAEGRDYRDPASPRVSRIFTSGPLPKPFLDLALEFLGYPKLSPIPSYC